jgi:hypothetical protein
MARGAAGSNRLRMLRMAFAARNGNCAADGPCQCRVALAIVVAQLGPRCSPRCFESTERPPRSLGSAVRPLTAFVPAWQPPPTPPRDAWSGLSGPTPSVSVGSERSNRRSLYVHPAPRSRLGPGCNYAAASWLPGNSMLGRSSSPLPHVKYSSS